LVSLKKDREYLKEMLCRGTIDNEAEVRGRCNAILAILDVTYEDLVEGVREND
jgi:hypothetical protein